MTNQDNNNQWLTFLEEGADVPNAIKAREVVDTQKALRVKYPTTPIPMHKALRTISQKQREAIGRD